MVTSTAWLPTTTVTVPCLSPVGREAGNISMAGGGYITADGNAVLLSVNGLTGDGAQKLCSETARGIISAAKERGVDAAVAYHSMRPAPLRRPRRPGFPLRGSSRAAGDEV